MNIKQYALLEVKILSFEIIINWLLFLDKRRFAPDIKF